LLTVVAGAAVDRVTVVGVKVPAHLRVNGRVNQETELGVGERTGKDELEAGNGLSEHESGFGSQACTTRIESHRQQEADTLGQDF
jgi:hypothetical protein